MKNIAYFICFLYFSFLNPVDVFIGSIEKRKDNLIVNLNVDIDESELICKDDIMISVDDPSIVVNDYQIINYSQKEIFLTKTKKKGYKNPFIMKVFLSSSVQDLDVLEIYFSCFVVNEEEEFRPFIKKVSHEFNGKIFNKLNKKVKNKIRAKIKYAYESLKKPAKEIGVRIFNAKILTLLLVVTLFLSFVLFSVLSIEDLLIILSIFVWGYFSKFIFVREVVFFILAILLLISSVWFFINYDYGKSFLKKIIRLFLGFLCASLVLPLLLEVYLSRCFINYLSFKDSKERFSLVTGGSSRVPNFVRCIEGS